MTDSIPSAMAGPERPRAAPSATPPRKISRALCAAVPGKQGHAERPAVRDLKAEKEDPSRPDDLPPTPWTCPQCGLTIETREAGPRCARCGYREP